MNCSTYPGQQPYGLQEALSVGRIEDPNLQQVLVFHHIAALQGNKTNAKVSINAAFSHTDLTTCLPQKSALHYLITMMQLYNYKTKRKLQSCGVWNLGLPLGSYANCLTRLSTKSHLLFK